MECFKTIVYMCILLTIEIGISRASLSESQCIPLVDCPFTMKLIESSKYEPSTTELLKNSHCGYSKDKGPLTLCPVTNFCRTPDGRDGICELLSQCDSLLKTISNGIEFNRYRCNSHMTSLMYVCCPPALPDIYEQLPPTTQNGEHPGFSVGLPPKSEINKTQNGVQQSFVLGPLLIAETSKTEIGAEPVTAPDSLPMTEISKTQNGIQLGFAPGSIPASSYGDQDGFPPIPPLVIDTIPKYVTVKGVLGQMGKVDAGSLNDKLNSEWGPSEDACTTPEGKNGTCEAMIDCPHLLKTLTKTQLIEYKCTPLMPNEPYICCPTLSQNSLQEVTEQNSEQKVTQQPNKSIFSPIVSFLVHLVPGFLFRNSSEEHSPRMRYAILSPTKVITGTQNFVGQQVDKRNSDLHNFTNNKITSHRMKRNPAYEDSISARQNALIGKSEKMNIWPFRRPYRKPINRMYPGSYDYDGPYYYTPKPEWHHNNNNNNNNDNDDEVYILKPSDYPENHRPVVRNNSWQICGRNFRSSSQRIIGGTQVGLGEHPWMALIQYRGRNKITNGCGATLISSRYILTAAHCVDVGILRSRQLQLYRIILGEHDTTTDPDCTSSPNSVCADPFSVYTASAITKHEQFNSVNAMHDIALIRLDREVVFSDYVKPICLPSKNFILRTDKSVIVAGWGRIGTGAPYSKTLTKATLPLVSTETCNTRGVNLIPGQMCLGLGDGVDTCTGDSGGPMMMQRVVDSELVTYQVGIISYGFATAECGKAPSVNTYLPYYLDWIFKSIKSMS